MQSIKSYLLHKELCPNIGARSLDFNIKSMFFAFGLSILNKTRNAI
jgi:hypothetical protein